MQCRTCGNTELKQYYTQGHNREFVYYRCPECTLVNLDMAGLDFDKHQAQYAEEYVDPRIPAKNYGSYATFKFIQKHVPNTGTLFDIGSGNGSLLFFAREDGWKVKGLELSTFLAEKTRETLGMDIVVANFLTFPEDTEQYDLVSLRHVIEHLPDPNAAMSKINHFTKSGGFAVFEFPNIEALKRKWDRFLENSGMHKKSYPQGYLTGHCNHFAYKSFKFLAEKHGFKMIKWQTYASSLLLDGFYNIFPIATRARVLLQKNHQ